MEEDLKDPCTDEKILFISDFYFSEEEDGTNCFSSVQNRKTGTKVTTRYVMVDNVKPNFPISDE